MLKEPVALLESEEGGGCTSTHQHAPSNLHTHFHTAAPTPRTPIPDSIQTPARSAPDPHGHSSLPASLCSIPRSGHTHLELLQRAQEHTDTDTRDFDFAVCVRVCDIKDGQLWNPAAGLFPVSHRHRGADRGHRAAAVEDVRVHRRQHHHGRGHVSGAVDVLRLPEHRAAPVQDLRLHPAARQ